MAGRSTEARSRHASTDLLHAALAQSSIALAVCDHDFTVRFFNAAIGRLIDRANGNPSRAPGVLRGDIVLHSLGIADVASAMATVTAEGGWQGRSDGVHITIEPFGEPFGDAGSAAGWLITAREQGDHAPATPLTESELITLSSRLTPREREVMLALHQGASNKAIAQQLAISPRTVEFHRARIMTRFDARSLVDLVRKVAADARVALADHPD